MTIKTFTKGQRGQSKKLYYIRQDITAFTVSWMIFVVIVIIKEVVKVEAISFILLNFIEGRRCR